MSVQNLGFIRVDFSKTAQQIVEGLENEIAQMAQKIGYEGQRIGIVQNGVKKAVEGTLSLQQFEKVGLMGCHVTYNDDSATAGSNFSYSLQYGEPAQT